MKKLYMLTATLLTSAAMMTNAQPTLNWANNINYTNAESANITNIGYNVAMAQDGNVLVFADCGTTSTEQGVQLGSNVIGTGTDYNSTSYNHGMFLVKVNPDNGDVIWSVYSNVGESSSNQGAVVPTSDGGAYLVAKVRQTINRGTEKINFVDATGTSTAIDWVLDTDDAKRYYNGIIMHVSSEGAIEWYRLITMNHDPQPNASSTYSDYTSEGIYIQTATTDNNDNLYVAGRYCTAMTFDNGTTLTPQNVEGWNGDPQKAVGDPYIIKFDNNGNYVSSLLTEGVGDVGQFFSLKYNPESDKLYAVGYYDGIADNTVTLGGITLNPGNTAKDLLVACVNTDLTVKWATLFQSTYTGSTFNKLTINPIGENLWITGKVRTSLTDGTNSIDASSNVRDGLLLHLNKADGTWLGATTYGTNQAGFNGVFESNDDPDTVYVYGHTLLGNLFIQRYSINDLTAGTQWVFSNKSSDIQNFAAVCNDNKFFTMDRVQKGDVTVYYDAEGTRTVTQNNGFNTLVCGFTLPVTINTGDAVAAHTTGDVNHDKIINISDVTMLIDRVLNDAPIEGCCDTCGDINGDGELNITDVTLLIDLVLAQ